jgi:hypothetical protein
MNATKTAELLAKLQAFADTLDINEATVEIGTRADRGVVWLKYRRIGCERVFNRSCGLTSHGIRYIKRQMKEFEASMPDHDPARRRSAAGP